MPNVLIILAKKEASFFFLFRCLRIPNEHRYVQRKAILKISSLTINLSSLVVVFSLPPPKKNS